MICPPHKPSSHPTTYHHSTETVVHMTTNYLISKYNGHFLVIILLDLFVAFKTVDLVADHWALLVVLSYQSFLFGSLYSKVFLPPSCSPRVLFLAPTQFFAFYSHLFKYLLINIFIQIFGYRIRYHGKQQRWVRKSTFLKSSQPNEQDR